MSSQLRMLPLTYESFLSCASDSAVAVYVLHVSHVSGECRFTESVFGMLKGTIVRESVQGMRNAYNKYFREVVREAFGVIEEEEGEDKKGGLVGAKGGLTDGVMNLAATNPALFVALLAAIVIIMRMITQQQLYTHLLRKAMAA